MRGIAVVFGAALIIASPPSHSQTAGDAPLSEQDFFTDFPIVLSASRIAQPVTEAPVAVSTITHEMIVASGFRRIPDLFRLVPGFNVGFFRGDLASVTYHGLADESARRLQVLVDGRSIYSPGFDAVDWSNVPIAIEDIDRIEIVRGPNAASYGSNSFQAVINIITRHPSVDRGLYASVRAGERDIADGLLRFGAKAGELDYRLTLATRGDDRFASIPDRQQIYLANFRSDYRIDADDRLEVHLGYSDGRREEGFFGDVFLPPRRARVSNRAVQLHWQRAPSSDSALSLRFSHTENRTFDDYAVDVGPPFGALPFDFSSRLERDSLEFQQIARPAASLRSVWGTEIRQDRGRSRGFFADQKLNGEIYRLFGQLEWQISDKWLANTGAMLENHYYTGTDLSPRFALTFAPSPNHALRAGVSKAYRTPSFFEEQANQKVVANGLLLDQIVLAEGGLRAETVVSKELAYLGRFPSLGLSLDLRLFHDKFSDLIDIQGRPLPPGFELTGAGDAATFRNTDEALIRGVEYQLVWQPTSSSQLLFNQAFVDIKSSDVGARFSQTAPTHSASLLAIQRFPRDITASLGFYRVGEMLWLGEGDFVDGYDRLDLRLAKRFHGPRFSTELALTIQGLLGPHAEAVQTQLFTQRAFVTLNLGF